MTPFSSDSKLDLFWHDPLWTFVLTALGIMIIIGFFVYGMWFVKSNQNDSFIKLVVSFLKNNIINWNFSQLRQKIIF